MTVLIEFKDITRIYGDVTALKSVNLKIRRGEIFTLLGPNGSGKTTALKIMAGIDAPTKGKLYFADEEITDANRRELRLRSTLVFQRTVHFNTTVYKNLAYGLKLRGHPKAEIDSEIHTAIKLVKLEGYERRLVRSLSGGEQQRVSLARALTLKTELLLLDEPTANLDPQSASIIEETVSRVNRDRGTTVVMATHNLFQAEALTDRGLIFLGGRVIESGDTQSLLAEASSSLKTFTRLENVFSGPCRPLRDGLSRIDIGEGLHVETAFQRTGYTSIYILPEAILISTKPSASSARNTFSGTITAVTDQGATVRLQVDVGKPFTVQITKRSFEELNLNLGTRVYIVFKASAVHPV